MAITKLMDGLPSRVMQQEVFDAASEKLMAELPMWGAEANALQIDVRAKQVAAAGNAASAETSREAAAISAALAQSASVRAVAAADLIATSSTSNALGNGIKNFIVEPGKAFRPGVPVRSAFTAAPGSYMDGYVRTYDPATGALSMQSQQASANGTGAAWSISITGATPLGAFFGGGNTYSEEGVVYDHIIGSDGEKLQRFSSGSGGAIVMPSYFNLPNGYHLFELSNEVSGTWNNDLTLKNADGIVQAFLPAGRSTAAHFPGNIPGDLEKWIFPDASLVGKPIRYQGPASIAVGGAAGAFLRAVQIDSDRILFLIHGVSMHAIVFNQVENTWGAPTLVRSTWGGAGAIDNVRALLIDVDTVLVASCRENTTSAQMVVLSLSESSIAVGAAQATALGAAAVRLVELTALGGSYVLSYMAASNVLRMQARTVAGVTVSAPGAEIIGATGTAPPAIITGAASTYVAVTANASNVSFTPYSVAGTVITAGSPVTAVVTDITQGFRVRRTDADRWLVTYVNSTVRVAGVSIGAGTVAVSAGVIVSSTITAVSGLQVQQAGFFMQIASTGTTAAGLFVTEFACVSDPLSGAPTLVGSIITRTTLAAQTCAPAGSNDQGLGGGVTVSWMISHAKGIEVHSFISVSIIFQSVATYRIGPSNVSLAQPVPSIYPKEQLALSTLSKFGSTSFALLGDGSKPSLYSASGNDLGTMRTSPAMIVDPANGARGADFSSLWLAHSMGTDAVITIEKVQLA